MFKKGLLGYKDVSLHPKITANVLTILMESDKRYPFKGKINLK
jgi:hypothetical protein